MTEERSDGVVPMPTEDELREGDRAAKAWFFFSTLWFGVFATFGFVLAIRFFYPRFLGAAE